MAYETFSAVLGMRDALLTFARIVLHSMAVKTKLYKSKAAEKAQDRVAQHPACRHDGRKSLTPNIVLRPPRV